MADMTRSRFEAIVAAYGADPRRWPEGERAAAEAFARNDAAAGHLLDAEWAFDRLLLSHAVPSPSSALSEAVLAARPPAPWLRRARIWWSALALGLAGAGGVLAGSAATAALVSPSGIVLQDGTAFGDLDDPEALP